ncbi:hypothetical protein T06_200 [Trichinella sp. T6]|nr:hypothetical protein T06_200 [Trichinella sp. T6]
MPQAIFRKFRNFSKIAPGDALRLRPRANKNLHIPSGYASGVLLHHICPQGRFMQIFNGLGVICKFLYALRLRLRQFFENFEILKYSPRLFPQATPQGNEKFAYYP